MLIAFDISHNRSFLNTLKFGLSFRERGVLSILVLLLLSGTALSQGGRLDLRFPTRLANDANVTAMEAQPDGKILAAGKFTTVGSIVRRDIVRLNQDGTIDPTFNAGTGSGNGSILSLKLQPDGRILVGGNFNTFDGTSVGPIVRLNGDGTRDTNFNISGINVTFAYDLDLLPDGKVVASISNAIGSSLIVRFDANGSNGQIFYSSPGNSGYRLSYIASENRFMVAAANFNGPNQGVVHKTTEAGVFDGAFFLALNLTTQGVVEVDVRPLGDGRILIFGRFDLVNQVARRNIAIINADGGVDPAFLPDTQSAGPIRTAVVQANGKVVVAGRDFIPNGTLRGNIGRLNANGSVDTSFKPGRGANTSIKTMLISDGNILVGGDLFRFDTRPASGLIRVIH